MKAAIYNIETGKIDRIVTAPPSAIAIQVQEGEEFCLNPVDGANHIVNGQAVYIAPPPPPEPTTAQRLAEIRRQRDMRLKACDWTQLPDAPLNRTQQRFWAAYRQALRDFTKTCDLYNPVWPKPPTGKL